MKRIFELSLVSFVILFFPNVVFSSEKKEVTETTITQKLILKQSLRSEDYGFLSMLQKVYPTSLIEDSAIFPGCDRVLFRGESSGVDIIIAWQETRTVWYIHEVKFFTLTDSGNKSASGGKIYTKKYVHVWQYKRQANNENYKTHSRTRD